MIIAHPLIVPLVLPPFKQGRTMVILDVYYNLVIDLKNYHSSYLNFIIISFSRMPVEGSKTQRNGQSHILGEALKMTSLVPRH